MVKPKPRGPFLIIIGGLRLLQRSLDGELSLELAELEPPPGEAAA
jgi:hypothetical protein